MSAASVDVGELLTAALDGLRGPQLFDAISDVLAELPTEQRLHHSVCMLTGSIAEHSEDLRHLLSADQLAHRGYVVQP